MHIPKHRTRRTLAYQVKMVLVVLVTVGNFARNAEREPVTVPGELPEPAL